MPTDSSFRMVIADVFTIKGRGMVVTGQVESGVLKVGDEVHFKGHSGVKKTVVTGLEAFRKQIAEAQAGDNIGVLLQGIDRGEIRPGDVLAGTDADFSWNV